MTASLSRPNAGWILNPGFDRFFIFGTVGIALLCGMIGMIIPGFFMPILMINLWILGYHHVITTFTRLCFDSKSHKQSWLLIYLLIPAVLAFVLIVVKTFGIWPIATIYLYAQWFHYSRQSWGISRAYERNAPAGYSADRSWQTKLIFYGLPVTGILYRSWQHPGVFLGMPLKTLPVPFEIVAVAGAACAILMIVWLLRVYSDWRRGVLPLAYTGYMASHFTIFIVGYLLMPTLDTGWLVTNIWHNAQYILFVWMFNVRRYRNGVDKDAPLMSFISQQNNAWLYFGITLGITSFVYGLLYLALGGHNGAAALVIAYQAINFHHYIVDAVIWRSSWIGKGKPSKILPAEPLPSP